MPKGWCHDLPFPAPPPARTRGCGWFPLMLIQEARAPFHGSRTFLSEATLARTHLRKGHFFWLEVLTPSLYQTVTPFIHVWGLWLSSGPRLAHTGHQLSYEQLVSEEVTPSPLGRMVLKLFNSVGGFPSYFCTFPPIICTYIHMYTHTHTHTYPPLDGR